MATQRELPDLSHHLLLLNYYSYHFLVSPLLQQPVEFSLDSNAVELSCWLKSKGLLEEDCEIIRGMALRELLGCRAMSH